MGKTAPPLEIPARSVQQSALGEGGGGQVMVPPPGGRGGGVARVFQGKLWYPPLMQANRTQVKRLLH